MELHYLLMHFSLYSCSHLQLKHEVKHVPASYLFAVEMIEMEVWQGCVYR